MDSAKKKIAAALMVSTFLSAFDGTVMATAAPAIARELSGFSLMSGIFSLYLFLCAVSTPLSGKLADLFGRKKVLTAGISIFLVGSVFCGLSQSMEMLVAFRAVQGLGAGAIFTINFTIIGDVYEVQERSVIQGAISTIWGVAGLIGPLIGGFFIDYVSWNWVFFVNVPFGLFCIAILQRYLTEPPLPAKPRIDFAGAFCLSACICALLYGIMAGYANGTWPYAAAAAILCAALFVCAERRAAEPIVPAAILDRPMVMNIVVTFFVSLVLIGGNVYLPMYIQIVMGSTATLAGMTLAAMSTAWTMCSFLVARLLRYFGTRMAVLMAASILAVCSFLLTLLVPTSSFEAAVAISFLFGFGFSGTLNVLMFMVQDSVVYERRGIAVGVATLIRSIAQTLGASLFGTMINTHAAAYLQGQGLPVSQMDNLMDFAGSGGWAVAALQSAFHFIFIIFTLMALAAMIAAWWLPVRHAIARR
jgi:EmrB/QacA subfamily drug resistance transporter